jgi:hypothetical protein
MHLPLISQPPLLLAAPGTGTCTRGKENSGPCLQLRLFAAAAAGVRSKHLNSTLWRRPKVGQSRRGWPRSALNCADRPARDELRCKARAVNAALMPG